MQVNHEVLLQNVLCLCAYDEEHLRVTSNMIYELKAAENNFIDEKQVQAVIHSLPNSWETMSQKLMHNENIKTFDVVACHLELEAK